MHSLQYPFNFIDNIDEASTRRLERSFPTSRALRVGQEVVRKDLCQFRRDRVAYCFGDDASVRYRCKIVPVRNKLQPRGLVRCKGSGAGRMKVASLAG